MFEAGKETVDSLSLLRTAQDDEILVSVEPTLDVVKNLEVF
jgi:hypothetical protein